MTPSLISTSDRVQHGSLHHLPSIAHYEAIVAQGKIFATAPTLNNSVLE
jgi:hypothetical protein